MGQRQAGTDFVLNAAMKARALKNLGELRGEIVYLVSKNSQSPLAMFENRVLSAEGGLGQWAQWKVEKKDMKFMGCAVVGFRNVGHYNRGFKQCWLAIKNNQLCYGGGGEHCEFIVSPIDAAVQLIKHNRIQMKAGVKGNGQIKRCNNVKNGDASRWFI